MRAAGGRREGVRLSRPGTSFPAGKPSGHFVPRRGADRAIRSLADGTKRPVAVQHKHEVPGRRRGPSRGGARTATEVAAALERDLAVLTLAQRRTLHEMLTVVVGEDQ
ncbi:hypothetical protein GCM10009726_09400 [Nocardioides furvisabuli]|uniref:Uncharacterized protein n=1 Tax=Nocardioides furvisabuli TaxID=375542 RepID=A0ABN2WVT4_9ACTN